MLNPTCEHPFDLLMHQWYDPNRVPRSGIRCQECEMELEQQCTATEFLTFRAYRFTYEHVGTDPDAYRDMLYNEIKVGSRVVYPVLSGRSAQLMTGEVVTIDKPTRSFDPTSPDTAQERTRLRHGAPLRMQIEPQRVGSRWRGWWSDGSLTSLTKNAASAVVVG